MQRMKLKAYGKVNLGLDVVHRREDGYHEVRMIMQSVKVYDRIELVRTKKPGIQVETNLFYLPINEDNLVYKAARLLMDEFSIQDGLFIQLNKFIPVSAGMAGGSSDAAAVLFGVNQMFQLKLSMEELMKRGVRIGADIPYCLLRGTALAEGIGEKLTPLPPMPSCHVLIAKPGISVSTKSVYENLKLTDEMIHPDIDGIKKAIEKQDFYGVASRLSNVLESVTIPEYPVIAQLKEKMLSCGAVNALMSGSGPTVFGLYEEEKTAKHAYEVLRESGMARQVYLTGFYNRRSGNDAG